MHFLRAQYACGLLMPCGRVLTCSANVNVLLTSTRQEGGVEGQTRLFGKASPIHFIISKQVKATKKAPQKLRSQQTKAALSVLELVSMNSW